MNWLIWKEYRLQRPVLMVGAGITLLPFIAPLIVLATSRVFHHSPEVTLSNMYGPAQWIELCTASAVTIYLTMALLGGNAIAGERSNRAAEFYAYLPVPRWHSLRNKLVVPALALLSVVGLNLLIVLTVTGVVGIDVLRSRGLADQGVLFLLWVGLAATAAFSVGWCLSSFLESPTFAVFGGLIAPWLAIAIPTGIIFWAVGEPSHDTTMLIYLTIWATLSCVCFLLGSYIYLRRVRP